MSSGRWVACAEIEVVHIQEFFTQLRSASFADNAAGFGDVTFFLPHLAQVRTAKEDLDYLLIGCFSICGSSQVPLAALCCCMSSDQKQCFSYPQVGVWEAHRAVLW